MALDEIILIAGWIAGFALNAAIALVATWFLPVRRRSLFFVCMVGAAVLAVFVASPTTMTVGNIAGYLINFIVLPCLFWKGPLLKRLICAFLLIVIEFVTEILLTGVFAFAGVTLDRDAGGLLLLVMRLVNIAIILGLGWAVSRVVKSTIGRDVEEGEAEGSRPATFWRYGVFLLPQLAFLVIGSILFMKYRTAEPEAYALFFAAMVICLAVDMIALFSLRQSLAAKRDAAQAEDLERQLALHVESARAADAELQRAARFRHDQRNHLQVLRGLVSQGDTERARSYVATLRHTLSQPACDTLEDEREVSARE